MAKPREIKPLNRLSNPDLMIPQNTDDYILRGWAYYYRKDYSKAIADLEKAYQSQPKDVDLNYAMGLTFKADGQKEPAVQHFQLALENLPSVTDQVRAHMLGRLIKGQMNEIQTGRWDLEKEIWHKEP